MEGKTIPAELIALPNWIRWTYKEVNGKKTKIPIQLNGNAASTTDPSTWTKFEQVRKYDKIGFVFTKESQILGIDLDHVIPGSELCEWAESIVTKANSYTEISPSGEGLHILGIGSKPSGMPSRVDMPNDSGVEVYDTRRYFTFTGKVFRNYDRLNAIDVLKVLDFVKPKPEVREKRALANDSDFRVSVHAVVAGLREEENRPHPFHDSKTGANFRVDKGGETWRCWRHSATGNALHLLGIREGIIECGERPSKDHWRKILEVAAEEGLILRIPKGANLAIGAEAEGVTA